VAALAGIAGAISYSHMRPLAAVHGDTGWHAHAFPLSVDGVEIVASLVLLADRRAGRRSGWLPWVSALTLLSRGVAHVIDQGLAWSCSIWRPPFLSLRRAGRVACWAGSLARS
jgi:hypothetical protein